MNRDRKLSSLELTVLGLLWLRGPRKAYAIMKELSLSPSTYHNTRAGATYSVVNRLVEFGLVERGEHLPLPPDGAEALREWLCEPMAEAELSYSFDPVRLRTYFLGAVEPEDRLAFIETTLAGLERVERDWMGAMDAHEALGEYFGVLGAAGALMEVRARATWLRIYREFLLNPAKEDWAATVRARLG